MTLWKKAEEFWASINEILKRPALQNDRDLRQQLSAASDSILANIAEGFEQPTDRGFARYLYISKGSTAEARTDLRICCKREYISPAEFDVRRDAADEVSRLATGLIKYLLKSNRRDRGIGRSKDPEVA